MGDMKRKQFLERRSHSEVEELLAEYRRSGLSQRQFAERVGVPVEKLRYWIYRPGAGNHGLVEVKVAPPQPSRRAHYRLEFTGGISLSFSSPLQVQELEQLCRLLRS
jgi:hypothetical protein